jgi:hypothetical protein
MVEQAERGIIDESLLYSPIEVLLDHGRRADLTNGHEADTNPDGASERLLSPERRRSGKG